LIIGGRARRRAPPPGERRRKSVFSGASPLADGLGRGIVPRTCHRLAQGMVGCEKRERCTAIAVSFAGVTRDRSRREAPGFSSLPSPICSKRQWGGAGGCAAAWSFVSRGAERTGTAARGSRVVKAQGRPVHKLDCAQRAIGNNGVCRERRAPCLGVGAPPALERDGHEKPEPPRNGSGARGGPRLRHAESGRGDASGRSRDRVRGMLCRTPAHCMTPDTLNRPRGNPRGGCFLVLATIFLVGLTVLAKPND
jgi:hypothetical protein